LEGGSMVCVLGHSIYNTNTKYLILRSQAQ
jgi:hypothetical protein